MIIIAFMWHEKYSVLKAILTCWLNLQEGKLWNMKYILVNVYWAWLRSTWCFPYIYALCKHFYILTTLIILTNSNNFRLQKQSACLIFLLKNFDCVKFGKRMNHFFMYLSKVWHGEWSRARSLPINLTGM